MKVRLLVSRSGVNGAQNRGEVVEVSTAEAKRMIEAGQAEPVRAERPAEKTVRVGKARK